MTKEEAQREIARLQKIVDQAENPNPEPIDNPDWSEVIELAIDEIREVNDGCGESDNDHYFYEAVMEAVYGKDVWKWINEKLE